MPIKWGIQKSEICKEISFLLFYLFIISSPCNAGKSIVLAKFFQTFFHKILKKEPKNGIHKSWKKFIVVLKHNLFWFVVTMKRNKMNKIVFFLNPQTNFFFSFIEFLFLDFVFLCIVWRSHYSKLKLPVSSIELTENNK